MSRSDQREEILLDLERSALFRGAAAGDIRGISEFCTARVYKKGERIFEDNDPGGRLFLIKTGIVTIHLFSITPAYDITITRLYAGEILGEHSILENSGRSTAATCMEEAELIEIPMDKLKEYCGEHPET